MFLPPAVVEEDVAALLALGVCADGLKGRVFGEPHLCGLVEAPVAVVSARKRSVSWS